VWLLHLLAAPLEAAQLVLAILPIAASGPLLRSPPGVVLPIDSMSLTRRQRIMKLTHTKGPKTRDLAVPWGESAAGHR
jgi:hypothetical protein